MNKKRYLILCFIYGYIMFMYGLLNLINYRVKPDSASLFLALYLIGANFLVLLGSFLVAFELRKIGTVLIKIGGFIQVPIGLIVATPNLKKTPEVSGETKKAVIVVVVAILLVNILIWFAYRLGFVELFDIKDGIRNVYYLNGNVKFEKHYKNGKLQGLNKQFFSDGSLMVEMDFREGKRDGIFRAYTPDGTLRIDFYYKDDKLEGIQRTYYINGQLNTESNTVNDKRHGLCTIYYESGKLRKKEFYKDDKLLETIEYDKDGRAIQENLSR